MTNVFTLNDQNFLSQFEACTLDPTHFDHLGHIRLGWLYATQNPLPEAIRKTCDGIQRYADSLGADDKFHYTLTEAFVRLIALRQANTQASRFDQFLEQNTDIVDNALALIHRHYSEGLLKTDEAKTRSVAPDLLPL
ncbi:hypothetical protein QKW35_06430 [Pontibacterium granulatum]|uniref:hypothetical protein n=1 Tax=Pontibacterium granulatum TaxID=2036029 RepID=UPI002499FAB8|nr:hypothetical protein [Pontibacterium granulatum]MDI3324007.1 hypothetical protein [Pontibacterium granulatum]